VCAKRLGTPFGGRVSLHVLLLGCSTSFTPCQTARALRSTTLAANLAVELQTSAHAGVGCFCMFSVRVLLFDLHAPCEHHNYAANPTHTTSCHHPHSMLSHHCTLHTSCLCWATIKSRTLFIPYTTNSRECSSPTRTRCTNQCNFATAHILARASDPLKIPISHCS
jgi:hypothetical protein